MSYEQIPQELKALRQWVCYGAPDRPLKMPFNPETGQPAKAGDPSTWTTFEAAWGGIIVQGYQGIGFEFAAGGGIVGIDSDHCLNKETMELNPKVAEWVQAFNSYTEISPSGEGLHILCKGRLPSETGKRRGGVEMYDQGRYFTMTGASYGPLKPLRAAQDAIDRLYRELNGGQENPPPKAAQPQEMGWNDVIPATGTEQDPLGLLTIIQTAKNAKNGERFSRLWEGDISGYPSHSEADQALCNILAFYTIKDPQAMDQLFRMSGLMRPKWDEKHGGCTYGEATIRKAIADTQEVYQRGKRQETPKREVYGLQIITSGDLTSKQFPPTRYVVKELLPQGLAIIAAPSKYGKSWFVLQMLLDVSAGKPFLNFQTVPCRCLYLALEDSWPRLQYRLKKLLDGNPAPDRFDFANEARPLGEGLIESLEDYIKKNPDLGILVIDTLQKIRGTVNSKESAYGADYREIGMLKGFADRHNICLLLVHHLRKAGDDGDPFNRISGTNGIMGAADTIMVMTREKRSDKQTTLSLTGRDVDSKELVLSFEPDTCLWQVLGDADWLTEQRKRLAYQSDPLVMTVKGLLKENPGGWSGTMSELMEEGKRLANTLLAESPRKLSSRLAKTEEQLFSYDKILHEKGKNGTGSATHYFRYNTVQRTVDENPQEGDPFG